MDYDEIIQLDGVVEKILYRVETDLFTVALVRAEERMVTVCGSFYALIPGEEVRLHGNWQDHARHGKQFVAVRYSKSFSPHVADREGNIHHWADIESCLINLQFLGLTMAEACRVFEVLGDDAYQTIRHNPYHLTGQPIRLAFSTADRVAIAIGTPLESAFRQEAAVMEALHDLLATGHTCVLLPRLIKQVEALLDRVPEPVYRDDQELERQIRQMEDSGALIIDEDGFVFRNDVYRSEDGIATHIHRLQRSWIPLFIPDIQGALSIGEERAGKTLSIHQRDILKMVFDHGITVITGGPGTGKTTILKVLLEACCYIDPNRRVLLTAPTGRAAKRLADATGWDAQTIHRLLGAKESRDQDIFEFDADHPLTGDLLIVDEFSMVDGFLADHLFQSLPNGMSIVLVGDVDQLPSVGPGQVLRDLIESSALPVGRLSTVFRQEETSAIILNAHRINHGLTPLTKDTQNEFLILREDTPEGIVNAILNEIAILRVSGYNMNDIQVLCPFHRGETGAWALNRIIREMVNPNVDSEDSMQGMYENFRLRDKVMQTRNDYDKGVFNGHMGIVEEIEFGHAATLWVRFDEMRVSYTWDELKDLSLGYAITVHKAQGSEFPIVIMPVFWGERSQVSRHLIYTAVTRAKEQVILVGRKMDLTRGIRNDRSARRVTRLVNKLTKN